MYQGHTVRTHVAEYLMSGSAYPLLTVAYCVTCFPTRKAQIPAYISDVCDLYPSIYYQLQNDHLPLNDLQCKLLIPIKV